MKQSFKSIVSTMSGEEAVELGRMFGADGLKIRGKVFAMEVKGELVVKLSTDRADMLIQSGKAQRFDPGHGRPMKQWVSLPPDSSIDWLELAQEAKHFVANA